MLDKKTINALETLYAAGEIPFTIMGYDGERLFTIPEHLSEFYVDRFMSDPPKTLNKSEYPAGITLVETGEFSNMAIVKINADCYAVTESVFSSRRGSIFFERLSGMILPSKAAEYVSFIRKLPIVSNYQLVSYVSLIKFICTGETAEGINFYRMIDPYHLVNSENKELITAEQPERKRKYSANYYKQILNVMKSGDKTALKKALHMPGGNADGLLSSDSLQQRKYEFVIHVKEAAETAIACGCDQEYIIELFESWCASLDSMHSISEIDQSYHYCLLSLCEKIHETLMLKDYSVYTRKAVQYITAHLYDPLNVQIVADMIPSSRQSAARSFEKDMHISLREYIVNQKLAEACRLLKEKDFSPLDISVILCFSSQSHFTELFKKKYGMTPKKYQKLNNGFENR